MEDAHSAVIGIPDQKENVSWFAGDDSCLILFCLGFQETIVVSFFFVLVFRRQHCHF